MKYLGLSLLSLLVIQVNLARADVVLVRDGKATAAIHVVGAVMDRDRVVNPQNSLEHEVEAQRQRLRESVKDLVLYLEKMSGGKVDIVPQPPAKDDTRVHIYIGGLAQEVFG